MIVNVHMTDGRTTFQFASRRDFRSSLGHEPGDDDRPVLCWARWNPDDPHWSEIRVQYVRKHSVAYVVNAIDEAAGDEEQLPAKATADQRVANWTARQEEQTTA